MPGEKNDAKEVRRGGGGGMLLRLRGQEMDG